MRLRVAAFALLVACSTAQTKETVVSLPSIASPSASIALAPPPPPVDDKAYALVLAGQKRWSGAHANVPSTIFAFYGAGRDVFAVAATALYHSADRGAHWTSTPSGRGSAIWGPSIDELYVASTNIMRSTDRGETWKSVAAPPDAPLTIGGRDASDVFAAGPGFITHSTDHGQTWQPVQHGIADATFYDIVSSPPDLYFVGSQHITDPTSSIGYHTASVILRTADGGRTFARIAPPTPGTTSNEESRRMCFTSAGTMFVAMAYSVHASSDRGKTWRRAASVGTEVLGLACSGRDVAASGRNKRFLVSADDGTTWNEHELDDVLGQELIALDATWLGSEGLVLVGGEAYTDHGGGTLLRRASR